MRKVGSCGEVVFVDEAAESVAALDTFTLAINPKMSYVPKEMTAADPDFWTPKADAPKMKEKAGGAQ